MCNTWCQFEACEQDGRMMVVGRSVRRMHKTKTEEKKTMNSTTNDPAHGSARSFSLANLFTHVIEADYVGFQ